MGVLVPDALLYTPGCNLGQKRQSEVGLNPQVHSHLHSAAKEFPGPGVEVGMEGWRGWDRVCVPKRSACPWAVGVSGGLRPALNSVSQDKNQGFQSCRSLEVSNPSNVFQGALGAQAL